jgi:hypothetical protein
MKKLLNTAVLILVALSAGFVGGLAGSRFKLNSLAEGVVRATRIEIVDELGRTKAFIGTDGQQHTALVFVDDKKRERAKFGVWSGSYTPTLVMTGADGNDRLAFNLGRMDERPMITLRDHERARVSLGFYQNDAPSPKDEGWGIRFYDPHEWDESLAAMGMGRDWNDGKMTGFVFVRGKDKQTWSMPTR